MIADLPENWIVYNGDGAGSSADVLRQFDLIDGEGERMSRRDGGTGRPSKPTRPRQPRAAWDVLDGRVEKLEEDMREVKADIRTIKGQLDRIIDLLGSGKASE